MLQRLIHSARVNVFESARFYYTGLIVFIVHLFLRRFMFKFFDIWGVEEFLWLKVITYVLYALVYIIALISGFFLRKQVEPFFLYCWLIIVSISIFNEIIYAKNSHSYSFLFSLTEGQIYYTLVFSLPIIFLGVWKEIDCNLLYTNKIMKIIENMVLINILLILSYFVFEFPFFESYPNSSRFGVSGFMYRGYSVFFSVIFLIQNWNLNKIKSLIFLIPLIVSGTKMGILAIALFIFFVIIKSFTLRNVVGLVCGLAIIKSPSWVPGFVSKSSFWSNILDSHGIWGVLFSLRDQKILEFWKIFSENISLKTFLFGGTTRYSQLWIEVVPIDILSWFGLVGLTTMFLFHIKLLLSWEKTVPLFSAFAAGFFGPLAIIILGLWCFSSKKINNKGQLKMLA